MMRLSNRIAATALAAVMAVSMLTACGGGGGGSTGAYPWLCLHRTSLKMLALVPKVRVAGPALWVRRSQASAEASMQLLFRM